MKLPPLLACILLAGCAMGPTPLSTYNPLTNPPWEAFVRPGPGAENDVDFETLNGPVSAPAAPQVLPPADQSLIEQNPQVASAPEQPQKPVPKDAEVIKAVAVLPVSGTGGAELTAAMRSVLDDAGWPILERKRKDAITIQGDIALSPPVAGNQTVTLVWQVMSPSGKNLGDVRQENTVPAGSLDAGWGDNATAASQAAAEGISKLIEKYR